jgi:adenylate kinase
MQESNQINVFFVGKPGSGKGTQAGLLSQSTGWPIKVASDGMREVIATSEVLGQKLKNTMNAGLLTPVWFPRYIFLRNLFALPEGQSAIYDGFQRSIQEAEFITEVLTWAEQTFLIVHLMVSDDEVRTRVELRSKTSGRADDHVLDKRLEQYYANTEPTINFLRETGKMIEINGEGTPEEIAAQVRKALALT